MRKLFSILLIAMLGATQFSANAILYKYDKLDSSKKTCRLTGWHGSQPSSGKLKLPVSYTDSTGTVYNVTEVDEHALDNLTEVTRITIPASYKRIGSVYMKSVVNATTDNFNNCPKLSTFVVEDGNTLFEASTDGLLFTQENHELLNVPAQLECNGTFVLPDYCKFISPDAFAGNTTIFQISLPADVKIYHNGGLNRMKNLSVIQLLTTKEKILYQDNGVLISAGRIIAAAPFGALMTYTVPDDITEISEYAFYNCEVLSKLNLNSKVKKIGKFAFAKTKINGFSIPDNVESLGADMLAECSELVQIEFKGRAPQVPDRFARDCKELVSVAASYPILSCGEAAFKNCRELIDFPFRGETVLHSDSVFFNTGFKEVIFQASPMADYFSGTHLFANCRNLELLDFSHLDTYYPYDGLSIGASYAPNCLKLKKVIFPAFTGFWRYSTPGVTTPPAFGYSSMIETVCISSTAGPNQPAICYSGSAQKLHYTPRVYATLTKNTEESELFNRCNIGNMFAAGNGATVAPLIYIDSFDIDGPRWPTYINYVAPNATYFIPGGALMNYNLATESGNKVVEMYGINFSRHSSGSLRIELTPTRDAEGLNPPTDFEALFETGDTVKADETGVIYSPASVSGNSKVRLLYKVDGNQFMTDYPSDSWLTTGNSLLASSPKARLSGKTIYFDCMAYFEVVSPDGHTLLSGHGESADLSELGSGIAIVRFSISDHEAIPETLKVAL
ncbi:MAG: leucine-rich repeat domain-containing protein [Muribaculaceae bacterium]|nr:leucine-rich repeat domain-containing protein [Muribaculaceae bacterium]